MYTYLLARNKYTIVGTDTDYILFGFKYNSIIYSLLFCDGIPIILNSMIVAS